MITATKWMSKEFRLQKYLGKYSNPDNHMFRLGDNCVRYFNIPTVLESTHVTWQADDFTSQMTYSTEDYFGMCNFGDINYDMEFPCLTKTRPITKKELSNNILTYIEVHRHWEALVKMQNGIIKDIPWEKKKNKMVWRGFLTNRFDKANQRMLLVKRFANHNLIDVGMNGCEWMTTMTPKVIKPEMSKEEMLTYKYIISMEGNDVASNLKWAMYSNSLVIMPKPTCESWFLESCLIPWVHFVPINETMEDVEEKLIWCIENDDKCQEIVKNANEYVRHFLNFEEEKKLSAEVIKAYFDKLTFTCTADLREQYGHLLGNKKNVVFV